MTGVRRLPRSPHERRGGAFHEDEPRRTGGDRPRVQGAGSLRRKDPHPALRPGRERSARRVAGARSGIGRKKSLHPSEVRHLVDVGHHREQLHAVTPRLCGPPAVGEGVLRRPSHSGLEDGGRFDASTHADEREPPVGEPAQTRRRCLHRGRRNPRRDPRRRASGRHFRRSARRAALPFARARRRVPDGRRANRRPGARGPREGGRSRGDRDLRRTPRARAPRPIVPARSARRPGRKGTPRRGTRPRRPRSRGRGASSRVLSRARGRTE